MSYQPKTDYGLNEVMGWLVGGLILLLAGVFALLVLGFVWAGFEDLTAWLIQHT